MLEVTPQPFTPVTSQDKEFYPGLGVAMCVHVAMLALALLVPPAPVLITPVPQENVTRLTLVASEPEAVPVSEPEIVAAAAPLPVPEPVTKPVVEPLPEKLPIKKAVLQKKPTVVAQKAVPVLDAPAVVAPVPAQVATGARYFDEKGSGNGLAATITTPPMARGGGNSAKGGGKLACVYCPKPPYPRSARRNGVEGMVKIKLVIAPDGRVMQAHLLSASPSGVFETVALEAARQRIYSKHSDRGGREIVAEIEFKLTG